ncbi:hypothetical protein Tco_0881547 [Tanacetum coccineum]
MSPAMEETPTNLDKSVCNTVNKEVGAQHDLPFESVSPKEVSEYYQKHHEQLLLFMAERSRNEKLKDDLKPREERSDRPGHPLKLRLALGVSLHALELRDKSKERRTPKSLEEATSLAQVSVKE